MTAFIIHSIRNDVKASGDVTDGDLVSCPTRLNEDVHIALYRIPGSLVSIAYFINIFVCAVNLFTQTCR